MVVELEGFPRVVHLCHYGSVELSTSLFLFPRPSYEHGFFDVVRKPPSLRRIVSFLSDGLVGCPFRAWRLTRSVDVLFRFRFAFVRGVSLFLTFEQGIFILF